MLLAEYGKRIPPFLLAIGLCFAPLVAIHRYPHTVFFNEWYAVAALCLATSLSALSTERIRTIPLPIVLIGFILIGLGARSTAGYPVYVSLFLVSVVVSSLSAENDAKRFVAILCWGLVAGAVLQCLVCVAQLAKVGPEWLIMPKHYNAVYGNIAQPNHLGNLFWLAQASLIYLWGNRRLGDQAALLATMAFSLFAAMTASRAVWFYIALVPSLCWLYFSSRRESSVLHQMAKSALLVAAGAVFMQMLMTFSKLGSWMGVVSSVSRAGDASSNGQRMFDWMAAWQTGLANPLTGGGAGTFSWQTALHSIGLPPAGFIRIGEHAHNTPLNFLAEFGWPVAVLICAGVALWLFSKWRLARCPEALWAFSILVVLGSHSMVEYPLWYTYFTIPAGLAVGVVMATTSRSILVSQGWSARWLLLPAGLIALGLSWTMRENRALEELYERFPYGSVATEASYTDSLVLKDLVPDWSVLAIFARAHEIRAWPHSREDVALEIASTCDRFLRFKTNFQTLTQCALAYALTGQEAESVQSAAMVCGAYPAMYHGRFPADLAALFQRQGWTVRPEMSCIRGVE